MSIFLPTKQKLYKLNWTPHSPFILGTGLSCSLKSTICKQIAQEQNFLYVELDELMMNALVDIPELCYKIFGCYPEPGDEGLDIVIRHYEPLTKEKEDSLFRLTLNYVNSKLRFIKANPAIDFSLYPRLARAIKYMPYNPRGVIGEGAAANLLDQWDMSSFNILFDLKNQYMRQQKIADKVFLEEGLTQPDIPDIRIDVHSDFIKDVEADCYVKTGFDHVSIYTSKQKIYNAMEQKGLALLPSLYDAMRPSRNSLEMLVK